MAGDKEPSQDTQLPHQSHFIENGEYNTEESEEPLSAGKRSSYVSLSGGQAEQNNPDSTYVMGSSINSEQQIPILQSFHVEHQRVTPTVPVESTGDTNGVDTLEYCRYFTTTGLALPPDKKGSLELHVLWDTGASHNFISRKWLCRYEQLFGPCPVVN
eukprot:scaffold1207_cov371-Pavlova_lutheri.AAC.6